MGPYAPALGLAFTFAWAIVSTFVPVPFIGAGMVAQTQTLETRPGLRFQVLVIATLAVCVVRSVSRLKAPLVVTAATPMVSPLAAVIVAVVLAESTCAPAIWAIAQTIKVANRIVESFRIFVYLLEVTS